MEQHASVLLWLLCTPSVFMISFSSTHLILSGRQAVYPLATCSVGGTPPDAVTLAAGEGRKFQSPGFPAMYGAQISCTYNFKPACDARLVFVCADVDLAATSAMGELCTGDYLRFYDEAGALGLSGKRYCFNSKPSFAYTTNINVLFKTNNDGRSGGGYDCQVLAESTTTETNVCPSSSTSTTSTTTTSTTTTSHTTSLPTTTKQTTTPPPPTTVIKGCRTVGGPGATKRCKPFGYGIRVEFYNGCINRKNPDQRPTSNNQDDFFEEFDKEDENSYTNFRTNKGSKRPRRVSTLFWCATEVGHTGYVTEWARCAQQCKVAGTFLPKTPKRGKVGFIRPRRGQTVAHYTKIIKAGNSRG